MATRRDVCAAEKNTNDNNEKTNNNESRNAADGVTLPEKRSTSDLRNRMTR